MKTAIGALGASALLLLGCGGGGGGSFACLVGTDTSQLCIETTSNASGTPNCGTGKLVAACSHAGADGACSHAFAANGVSLNQTIWYYSGPPGQTSQEMSDCVNNGGTWIPP